MRILIVVLVSGVIEIVNRLTMLIPVIVTTVNLLPEATTFGIAGTVLTVTTALVAPIYTTSRTVFLTYNMQKKNTNN